MTEQEITHYKDNNTGEILVCDPTKEHQWIKSDYYITINNE